MRLPWKGKKCKPGSKTRRDRWYCRAGRCRTYRDSRTAYGIQPIKSGKVYIKGDEVHPKSPIQATKLGIGLVSEDRKKQGLALDESIALNTVAVSLKKIFPRFFISNKKIKEIALDYKKQLRIATTSVNKACKYLSGGNQQKVVLAKWLSFDPDILIFDEPTVVLMLQQRWNLWTYG